MTVLRWCENNINQNRTIVQVDFEQMFRFQIRTFLISFAHNKKAQQATPDGLSRFLNFYCKRLPVFCVSQTFNTTRLLTRHFNLTANQ